ncbi:MAG: glycosyltransferase [Candidatus Omnitrophota bacterium]|jgi:cellulose synthase (UDP-forming)
MSLLARLNKKYFLIGFVFLSFMVTMIYVIVRLGLFLTAEYSTIERVFSIILMSGEFFILLHAAGYGMNIFRILVRRKTEADAKGTEHGALKEYPAVAILIPARHEPKEILSDTFMTMNGLNYKNKTIYFLDDSSDDKYIKEAEELAEEYNLKLFRRKSRHGAKAGIVNDCLKSLDQKYVAIFDADEQPMPEFLNALIPAMESDPKLSFVQTPQFYTNIEGNRVARGSAFQQGVFYEYICEGKSSGGAMYCCGTNVVFRREALVAVGGLDESTVTEDFATTVKLHASGWKTLYYNHVYAFGIGPEDLAGYFTQQFRWATGTIAVFRKLIWRALTKPFSLRISQWWEYLLSSTYYLIGVAFFFLMICPIAYILFKIPSFFSNPEIYFLTFLPYIALSIGVFYMMLTRRSYRAKDLFLGQLLGMISFSVYVRAAVAAMLGVKTTFGVTSKTKGKAMPYIKLWPQMSMIAFNFIAVVWGVNRFIYERDQAILVNGFWALYYFGALSSVFYFNGVYAKDIACKYVSKRIKFDYKVFEGKQKYAEEAWKACIGMFFPERLDPGSFVMIKLHLPSGGEVIIFEACVVHSPSSRGFGGYETVLGVTTISRRDKDRLEEALK